MKRCIWAIAVLLLVGAPCTYAQTFFPTITQATIGFAENLGSGDNLGATLTGPGVTLLGGGGTNCSWCFLNSFSNTPGTSLNPSTQVFYDFVSGNVTLGSQTYNCQGLECTFGEGTISALGNITFPANGQTFTVTVPAAVDPILLTVPTPGQGQGFVQAGLLIPSGELSLTFDFNPSFPNGPPPYYSLDQATFTSTVSAPEPGPLGLMVAGLVGILGLALKRTLPV